MKNKFFGIVLFALAFFMAMNSVQAGTITANVTETNINSTVLLTGADFSPSTMYYLIPQLENKSAWWDGYTENWFFSPQSTNTTINVTTNSTGGFTYSLYIPNDWRVSGGRVRFNVGEQVASSLLWSTQGNNFTVLPPKQGVTGDSNANGFVYASTNVAVANQGGITKFYKSNGTVACNWSDATVETINDISNNGSILYFVTTATSNNLRRINMTDCSLIASQTTANVASYSINIAPNNQFAIITYAALNAPRMYNITNTTPIWITTFANNTALPGFIAYDSCISPDSNTIYTGYANGNVTAQNKSGYILWNSNPPMLDLNATFTFRVNGLSCDNERVYVARSGVTVAGIVNQGFVEALWAQNGSRAWINSKTDTVYDAMDVGFIRCDSSYCYAVKAVPSATLLYGGPGIAGSVIVQLNKTTGSVLWQNWRSYLPVTNNGAYGTGGVHSSIQALWVDADTNGYLYPTYTNGWIQKIAKNDVNAQVVDTNLWIRGLTNFWNYVADVPKNIWLSNETPYYVFTHWNQQGMPLNTTNNILMAGSYFRFSTLNAFNEFTATETTPSLFLYPVIQVAPTQSNQIQMWNYTFQTNCPIARYGASLVGWHYADRSCLYEEIKANATEYNIGTTINGTWITGVIYSLVKTKFWEDYPITKYYGTDKWAWAAWYNQTNNQVLGFATKFGSDQEDVWADNYGRAVLFYNAAAGTSYYRPQFRADLNRKTDTYLFFMPQRSDGNNSAFENTLWHRVDIETQKVANPVTITLSNDESGSFTIGAYTYAHKIPFTAQEPNLFNRTNEPVEIIFNATGGIRSDCQDVVVTDASDVPINLWQVDNFTSCSQSTNVSVWIMMNWNQSETKNLRLYYNSSSATPAPSGITDLVVSGITGNCSTNNQTVNISSTGWYNWTRVANATTGAETTNFNFNLTTNMWTAATHLTFGACYKNSNTTGTGAGSLTDSCSAAAIPISRCLQAGGTGKIFAKLNATATIGVITRRPNGNKLVNIEYYFFGNTGRVRIRTQLNESIPTINTTVSKNWPPYYYLSINNLVPPNAPNSWVYYSGLYEQMKKPVVTFNADQTQANLSVSPLPMLFTIKYGGLNEVPQANGSIIRPSTLTDSFISNKGCTAHKEWQYYTYGVASYGAAATPVYTSEFLSCSQNVSSLLPTMGSGGYVNVFPEVSWWGTTANRWYDPLLIGKFYMQSNLWRPFNRENRWLSPYSTAANPAAITSSYQATARITTYIIKKCPTAEYGYKGYNDFLVDLPQTAEDIEALKTSGEIVTATTTEPIPCAAQIRKWTDKNGADAQEIIFAKNLSVIVGETFSPGWNLSYNTFTPGTYTLQADGERDIAFAMKASTAQGYYGKWFFTYTPYDYVNHAFSTSGNPQFTSATQIPLLEASHAMVARYSLAPEQPYVKHVFDESALWDDASQNFTYYRNPCFLGRMNNLYGATEIGYSFATTPSTPGWQHTQWGGGSTYAGTLTCPFNANQLEKPLDFRPAWQSGYPVSTDVAGWNAPMIDGRQNKGGNGTPPGAIDTYYTNRHNALLDYKHYDDYNAVIGDTSELNQNEKHLNKEPWYCQISRHTNRSFCISTSSLSTLVYNYNPGLGLTQTQPWSAYWSSVKEMSSFRNYFMRKYFDVSAWSWSYDHILEISLYPSLSREETLYSNIIYTSNNAEDYSKFFQKQFPTAQGSIDQNQFLLKDWKNSAFIVFNVDTRNYAAGLPLSVNGIAISSGEILNNSNINLGVYSENDTLVQEITTQTNSSGMFNWTLTLPNNISAGLYYVQFNYNNTLIDSSEFRAIGLIATTTNDEAAYEQGQDVATTITVTNSYTSENADPDQLELRYINPSSATVECAKYPNETVVSGCGNNLTKTSTGVYTYTFPIGSNPLGVYTQRATITESGIAADFDRGFVVALIDPCKANSAFDYALNYPIQYNNVTDVLMVVGNSSVGNSSNPITTEQMYEFAQATRGTCIIEKPATGTYTIKSQLVLGNGTQSVYVSSKGESIGFTTENMPQLFINKSAHLSFGGIADGVPQEGSSVKFTSNQSNDILLDVSGGDLAFYDSYVGDVGNYLGRFMYRGSCGILNEEFSNVNSSITIKKTIFDRATRGQFFYTSNVSIDDMKLNRINSSSISGYGIVSGCNLPSLNNLQIYHQEQTGGGIFISENTPNNTDLVITSSSLDYNIKDVVANKEGRGARLVNTQWDRTYGFNWSGSWSGTTTIQESYGYLPSVVDSSSSAIANTTLTLIDRYGNIKLNILTNSLGAIVEQNIPTWQVEKSSTEAISDFNPFNLKIKKYGKIFVSEPKTFSVRTVETKQLTNNPFTTLNESQALALTGIVYSPPVKVSYADSEDELVGVDDMITLNNKPISQSEFFGLYNDSGSTIPSSDYSINYVTGEITFENGYESTTARAVYSYGGNIQISGDKTLSQIYDFMQANLSDVFTTQTGSIYDSYVNIILGNSTSAGTIRESSELTLNFKEGYGFSSVNESSSTVNVRSDTWNFTWIANVNSTFSRKYSLDLLATYSNGTAMNGANVTIRTIGNQIIFSNLTNSSGRIPHQEISYATYNATNGENATLLSPHTIEITKSGYISSSTSVTVDSVQSLTYALYEESNPCDPDEDYAYALTYPMQYNSTGDSLTIIGNGTFGSSNNPITFDRMFEFARATKGSCIIQKPATGTYAVLSQLIIGNGTQSVYVSSKGESIGFSSVSMPELKINDLAHVSFGGIADGIPQEGCSIKFASNASNDLLLDVSGGELAFYDSYITDAGSSWGRFLFRGMCGNSTEGTYSNTNSSVIIKKTIFDRATRGQFFYTSNVSIDDMKLNRINSTANDGFGLIAGCSMPSLNNLQIYHQEQTGGGIRTLETMPADTSLIITSSTLDYNIKDVVANKGGRGVQLINTQWDRTYGFNWSGSWSGTTQIKENYGYNPTFVDTSSSQISNLTLVLINQYGEIEISEETGSSGGIGEQYIPTWQVEKTVSGEQESVFNPYTLYAKKYGKTFISEPKSFASRTLETKQVSENVFTTLSEATAAAVKNITYIPPTKVSYGEESNLSWTTAGQLAHYPVDQCQYFALFANGTKLAETSNYTIDYETGEITFVQNMAGMEIKPVYFYGGNITITNGFTLTGAYTMSKIYDYMSYLTSKNNLSGDLETIDGTTYNFCVNFIIGNSTHRGSVSDSLATISFEDGYDMSFSGLGGYVDLAGITSGGGSSGGLPLNIFDSVGSSYAPGNTVYIFSTVLNNNGQLVDASVDLSIYLPNGTLYQESSMTPTSTGRLDYSLVLPGDAQLGTWRVDLDAAYGGSEVHDNLAFLVSTSAGGGGGGGTNPSIQIDSVSVINTNENFGVFAFVRNNNSLLANCDSGASLTLRDSLNGTNLLNSVSMTNFGTGKYNYTFSLPYPSTFLAEVTCAVGGTTYVSNPKVISSQNVPTNNTGGTSGSAYPTIELLASTPIKTSTTASIGALVKSSSGVITTCDGSLGITIRNLADGTSSSGVMTNFGTGMYNYSWQTPATASVFYVNSSCLISGTSYTGFTLLSTQDLGATATIDYNQIAVYVWNYTSRNLTYYNQSVAESIQGCLRDGTCSNWWVNSTLVNVQNTLQTINTTVNQAKTNTETILGYFDCTSQNAVCTRLQNILNNVTDVQSRVYSLNVSQIPALQTSINNTYTDTQYIRTNMATASALQEINSSISWIRDTMVTQDMFTANLSEMRSRLNEINSTTQEINTFVDCSNPSNSALCSYLGSINTTVNSIYSGMATYSQVTNIGLNVSWIRDTMVTQDMFTANLSEMRSRLNEINSTTQEINTFVDCSNPSNSALCSYLGSINTTVNSIYSGMATYSQVTNIGLNVSWIRDNVATQGTIANNFSEVITRLTNMNSTLRNVHDDLREINSSLANQISNAQNNITWIVNNVATQEQVNNNFSGVLVRLGYINTTVYDTNTYLYGTITDALTEVNSTNNDLKNYLYNQITNSLQQINLTSQESYAYLITNVSLNSSVSTNLTEVLTKIDSLSGNLTYVKNNMFQQGNATGAFLVDYLSSVYVEPNNRAELWIVTRDLLGNAKTVSTAECRVEKEGTFIENASTSISTGGVYAYWNISSTRESGVYYFNCTLTGSTLNLKVPFFVGGLSTNFEISSLVSASPKYPNENAIVEATFSNRNGSVIPDTINLTILKPNYLTVWYTANKNDFTNHNGVWSWVQTIESIPTTGTYYVQMTATYNGTSYSKTTQFRIATGGPYKVYLDCPSTGNVGQDLACTVLIQDEGEGATESTTTVWIDTNNNGVLDGSEPQASFSKRTTPLQNVSQAVSLNIPSSHAAGYFVVRASTEYLNSAQPDSTASDSVTLQTNGSGEDTGSGTGGSSGGGGGGSSKTLFDVDFTKKSSATFTVGQGISKTFTFDGFTGHSIIVDSVRSETVTFVIKPGLSNFTISIGETKEIDINKDGLNDLKVILNGITNGIAEYTLEKIDEGVARITGKTIIRPKNLMDILVRVSEDYRIIYPNKNPKVLVEITFLNLGTEEIKDAGFTYCVYKNNVLIDECTQETVAVQTKIQLIKKINLPSNLEAGIYSIKVKANYKNETTESQDVFEVKTNETSPSLYQLLSNFSLNKSYVIIGIVSVVSLLLFIIIVRMIFKRKKKHQKIDTMEYQNQKMAHIEFKLKHLKELKAKREIRPVVYFAERERLLQKMRNIFKSRVMSLILLGTGLSALTRILTLNEHITGYVTEVSAQNNLTLIGYFILLIGAFGLLMFLHRKKIKERIEKTKEKIGKKYPENSVNGLLHKKVYSESGHYIGKIKEVILGENKIDGLKITVDKKHKFKAEGILLKWNQVISCKEIVIIKQINL